MNFKQMTKAATIFVLALTLLTSCATRYHVKTKGMARVRYYEICHKDIPQGFDGTLIVFASDFHYKSKFADKQLRGTIETIGRIAPDLIMLGGDYVEGCQNINALFEAIGSIDAPLGKYAVMGNNDYETCYDEIVEAMQRNGITLLEHRNDTITAGDEWMIVSGIRNPFDVSNSVTPTLQLNDSDFVIMLVHTPDYALDNSIANTDLVLSGHTHGGQITFFGIYAPVVHSRHGQRYRTGMKRNSSGTPIIITNGLGTSQRNIRLFAPSEVVAVELKCLPVQDKDKRHSRKRHK